MADDEDDGGKWRWWVFVGCVVKIDERNGDDVTVLTRCDDFLIGVELVEHDDKWLLLFRWWQHQHKTMNNKQIIATGIRILRRTINNDVDWRIDGSTLFNDETKWRKFNRIENIEKTHFLPLGRSEIVGSKLMHDASSLVGGRFSHDGIFWRSWAKNQSEKVSIETFLFSFVLLFIYHSNTYEPEEKDLDMLSFENNDTIDDKSIEHEHDLDHITDT